MRTRFVLLLAVASGVVALSPPATTTASGAPQWSPPVPGGVVRPFEAPLSRFGAGHLGVDFAAAPGTPVRAAGAGTVVFAGVVAKARHVVVRHAGGLRTTYSFLASIQVRAGAVVERGTVLGATGGTGENHPVGVLHFALRIGATFVDPMQLFAGSDLAARVHLAPLSGDGQGDTSGSPASWFDPSADERRVLTRAAATPPAPTVPAAATPAVTVTRADVSHCDRLIAPGPGAESGA